MPKTQGARSSVALAGFALPECPGSSSHVYPAHEGLTAVVHCGLVLPPSRVRSSMCTPVTPAVPYLLLGLQDVQWAVGNSRGARKLARTPHMNKKKIIFVIMINSDEARSKSLCQLSNNISFWTRQHQVATGNQCH